MTTPTKQKLIIIGMKPASNYAMAIATRFSMDPEAESVTIRARGEHISKAVRACHQAQKNKFCKVIASPVIGEEPQEGHMVSYIEITVERFDKGTVRAAEDDSGKLSGERTSAFALTEPPCGTPPLRRP